MNFPPLLSGMPEVYGSLTGLWQGVRQAFGRSWKTLAQTSGPLYQLILLVYKTVEDCFVMPARTGNAPSSQFGDWEPQLEGGEDLDEEDLEDLSQVDGKETQGDLPPARPRARKDALLGLGEFCKKVNKRWHQIDKELEELKAEYERGVKDNEQTAAEFEERVLKLVHTIVAPAQDILKEFSIKNPETLQIYLSVSRKMGKEFECLKKYVSEFQQLSEVGHKLIQEMIENVQNKTNALGEAMCVQVRCYYKRNSLIQSDGHCLFSSIADQLKDKKGQKYYRQLAADLMSKHPKQFESGILDALKSKLIESKVEEYNRSQGGEKALGERLEKTLGRAPTQIDFYCHCLKNTNLWGGTSEILALCYELEVPILVFTRQGPTTWRSDLILGVAEFKDKLPIILYYNGTNHYQNLSPRCLDSR